MSKIAGWLLSAFGWQTVGSVPELSHCVLIVAPHTSNWDFILGMLFKIKLKIKLNYFGKDSLFRWYNGWFFKLFGGQPVVRTQASNAVADKVKRFKESARFWLALAPEGTRSLTDCWRSGFYHIAVSAKVPLVLVFIDGKNKRIGFGPTLILSGNCENDMRLIAEYYENIEGVKGHLASPIRFKSDV